MENTDTINNTNRIVWVDWAKAICISCVVLGHSKCPEIRTIIYGFHIPLFFILSGYLFRPHNWKKTAFSFLVPVIIFSLFTFVMALPFEIIHHHTLQEFIHSVTPLAYLFSQKGNLFIGLWFIEVLFVMRLFMGDIKLFSKLKDYHLYVSVFCIILSIIIKYYNLSFGS